MIRGGNCLLHPNGLCFGENKFVIFGNHLSVNSVVKKEHLFSALLLMFLPNEFNCCYAQAHTETTRSR